MLEKINTPTIKSVLEEMKLAVEMKYTNSPTWWLEKAIQLNVLWADLKEEMTKYEMLYKQEKSDLIEKGIKIGQATLKVEGSSENYKKYSYLRGRDEIVSEFIKLAKKRATFEEYID